MVKYMYSVSIKWNVIESTFEEISNEFLKTNEVER